MFLTLCLINILAHSIHESHDYVVLESDLHDPLWEEMASPPSKKAKTTQSSSQLSSSGSEQKSSTSVSEVKKHGSSQDSNVQDIIDLDT